MNNILNIFTDELSNLETNYFILDTKGKGKTEHGDVDFIAYYWEPSKYNRVKPGDLFLYRRPTKASEISGKFYFFGAGKIEQVELISPDRLKGTISKPTAFNIKLLQDDLEGFNWSFKQKGPTWEHFFNQYGMNQIHKSDFTGILSLAFPAQEINDVGEATLSYEVELIQQQQRKDYFVDDEVVTQKRRIGQKVFADQVKLNYGYKCAITGIKTKEFLIGSHIVPWSERKESRLDPQNGICLSVLVDKAFDKGYLTITKDYRLLISPLVNKDATLYEILKDYDGIKIHVPKHAPPNTEYLQWHRDNVYKE